LTTRDDDSPATHRDMKVLAGSLGADAREQRQASEELQALVRKAVADGMRDVINDHELIERFWKSGYAHLSEHTTDSLSQWVGKRVLMILVAAALSSSIAWAVMTGRIK
jgi:hypothetical protein